MLKRNIRYIHCGFIAINDRNYELTIDECLEVADKIVILGSNHVTIIDGEVFLYDGLESVARRLRDEGVLVNITNDFLWGMMSLIRSRGRGLLKSSNYLNPYSQFNESFSTGTS